jgi:hypothetical protein
MFHKKHVQKRAKDRKKIDRSGLVHLSGQFSAGCEAPICRAFLLIHSAFGYGFVESRNIWGLSLGRNFDRKGERGHRSQMLHFHNRLIFNDLPDKSGRLSNGINAALAG